MLTFGAFIDPLSGSFPFIYIIPALIDGQCPQTAHFSSRVPTQKGRIDFYIPVEKVRPFNLAGRADGFSWRLGATLGSHLYSQLESRKIQAATGGGGIKRVAGAA